MKRRGEPGLRIPNDNARAKHGWRAEEIGVADQLLRSHLALFVWVAELVADIQFILENAASPQPGDIGGRDLIKIVNACIAAQVERILCTANVGAIRLAVLRDRRLYVRAAGMRVDRGAGVGAQRGAQLGETTRSPARDSPASAAAMAWVSASDEARRCNMAHSI